MTYGFNTKKTPTGFMWKIEQTVWDDAQQKALTTVVKHGESSTRAKALGQAKRWVLFLRKGGKVSA